MSDTKIVPGYSQDRTLGNLELAVVVPTFNEIENIVGLIDAVQAALEGHAFEMIVVDDDSPDGTADQVRKSPSATSESAASNELAAVG